MLPTVDSSFSVGHRELATRATHSGTWTAVNSPLSIAASRLQTETQNVYRRVLTHWLSYRPCTVYLDCCQHPALHGCFPSTNRNTKRLQKSADTLTELWAMHSVPGLLSTARSPLLPPVYKQKHETSTEECWHTEPQAMQWCQQTAHSPLLPPVYKQKHKKLTKPCWQHWATQSGTWTAVNIPFSTAASHLQTKTQNINRRVLTNWVMGHAQQYLHCRQQPALHCHLPSTNRNTKH